MPARKRINSKVKGKRGELWVANWLKGLGFPAARTVQHSGRGGGPFDVAAPTCPIPHWEVKFEEALNLQEAMAKAAKDAEGRTWALAWKKKNKPVVIAMHEEAFKTLLVGCVLARAWEAEATKAQAEDDAWAQSRGLK